MKEVYRLAYTWLEKWLITFEVTNGEGDYFSRMASSAANETSTGLDENEKSLYQEMILANCQYIERLYRLRGGYNA